MQLTIIKLFFNSMVHFGTASYGIEDSSTILHSDTLFGALANAWFRLYAKDEVMEFLKIYKEKLPLKFSSAFPFIEHDNYFFPLPCNYFDLFYPIPDKACLLYTSPSPRDLSTSRMPSSA